MDKTREATANDRQEGGNHYSKRGLLQHWDVVNHFELDYFQGQISKYLFRWRDKGGILDLRKAQHFLQKYIELEIGKQEKKTDPILSPGTPITRELLNSGKYLIHLEVEGKTACGVQNPSNVSVFGYAVTCPSCQNKMGNSNDARNVCQERDANAMRHEQSSDEVDILPDECTN